jgi:hypothetical protein
MATTSIPTTAEALATAGGADRVIITRTFAGRGGAVIEALPADAWQALIARLASAGTVIEFAEANGAAGAVIACANQRGAAGSFAVHAAACAAGALAVIR